jgi:superfamily II DNA/RNA helicase
MTTQQSFADLGVGEPMIKVLAARGIVTPFPIQVETLPDTLAGRDALGRGKTGSGKTLAFCIPLVDRLARMRRSLGPTGLVLAPTRELAPRSPLSLSR